MSEITGMQSLRTAIERIPIAVAESGTSIA
jgi:hypothetical protein